MSKRGQRRRAATLGSRFSVGFRLDAIFAGSCLIFALDGWGWIRVACWPSGPGLLEFGTHTCIQYPRLLSCRGDTANLAFSRLGGRHLLSTTSQISINGGQCEFYYNASIQQYKGNPKTSAPKSHQRPDIVTNGTPCPYVLQKKREPRYQLNNVSEAPSAAAERVCPPNAAVSKTNTHTQF
jgi:hypothetical protein